MLYAAIWGIVHNIESDSPTQESQMIEQTEIMPTLLEICPDFRSAWEEQYRHGEEPNIYGDCAEFVHYLVGRYEQNDRTTLSLVFEAIESFIVQGTPDTREVAIIGILEGLQNVAAGRWYGQKVFVKYLRPESKVAWDELNASWGYAKTSLGSRVYLFYQKMAHKMAGRKGRKRPEL